MEAVLASFVVIAYNQENYIRDAIDGAFYQTYSPLEIILSDDCSTDSTFEIMKSMAAVYRGPHTIRLNRNERNLGIASHFNKVFDLIESDFFIGAAGDDISLPNRVERIMCEFQRHPDWMAVASSVQLFGDKEEIVITANPNRRKTLFELCIDPPSPRGCAAAYRRELYDKFPLLHPKTLAEDIAYTFRAGLLGVSASVSDVLVKYRVSINSVSLGGTTHRDELRKVELLTGGCRQRIADFDCIFSRQSLYERICRRFLLMHYEIAINRAQPFRPFKAIAYQEMLGVMSKTCRLLHYKDWRARKLMIRHIGKQERVTF